MVLSDFRALFLNYHPLPSPQNTFSNDQSTKHSSCKCQLYIRHWSRSWVSFFLKETSIRLFFKDLGCTFPSHQMPLTGKDFFFFFFFLVRQCAQGSYKIKKTLLTQEKFRKTTKGKHNLSWPLRIKEFWHK